MKFYSSGADAIHDLHKRGFTNDFQLFGDDLLWVGQEVFIGPEEFAILECHKVISPKNNNEEMIVFGVLALHYNIKGLLLCHRNYTNQIPTLLVKKLQEMNTGAVFMRANT